MEEKNCLDISVRLTYLSRDEHPSIWWSIKKKNWNSHTLPLLTIVHMASSNTMCMKSKWQGWFIHFSRIFQDPTLIYMNLPSTKQNVCVETYFWGINMCTCRNARQGELENMCKPLRHSQCISGSISRILLSVYLNICFRLL